MPTDLLVSPCHSAQDLGRPMPDDPHAVSACLPLWSHNVGYEEGDPAVINQLQAAYPRFCLHPTVQQLCDEFLNDNTNRGLPFVSHRAAQRAADYVRHAAGATATVVPFRDRTACGVTVAAAHFATLKQYWQHAGENVSSRVAAEILNGTPVACTEIPERTEVRDRVAGLQRTVPENTWLFPSGMAAIASVYRAVRSGWRGETCQFGFPYVDTLKIQQRFPDGNCYFLPVGNESDLQKLAARCQSAPPVAVFCEVPTNPLLVTPNVDRLRELADRYGFLLIIDDTLAACGNLILLPHADVLVTSLTKYFSGYGDVLAGAITLNPDGRHFDRLSFLLASDFEETLSDMDVRVLARNSADLSNRMELVNRNAEQLARFLREQSGVESVYYPDATCSEYEAVRAPNGGYGGLMSIVLRDAERSTPIVFDALEVCKGPNLGTRFTLCCPYTILAHYTELDFAERCGVSRWLLRISVGIEPIEELQRRFAAALSRV